MNTASKKDLEKEERKHLEWLLKTKPLTESKTLNLLMDRVKDKKPKKLF
jgi:hypothetical protein